MVRRLLLTALLAALAVALPVAAEEGGSPELSGDPCLSIDLVCGLPEGDPIPCGLLTLVCTVHETVDEGLQSTSCDPYDLTMPGDGPITDTLVIDPDGCLRGVIRRVLEDLPAFGVRLAGYI